MSGEKPHLLNLARAILQGAPIDWPGAETEAARSGDLELIKELKVVAEIVALHRRQQNPGLDSVPARPLFEWGRLEVLGKVGEGRYGEVFRARDRLLDREVALKLLREAIPGGESIQAAAIEEGRLLARVRHPNVITVYGAERHQGRVGLWMEFIRGRTLTDILLDHGVLGAHEAGPIGLDLCRALGAVHCAGLIHGDVKAANVMRESGGRIVLMDFSAGREAPTQGKQEEQCLSGTPLYMAPEVLRGAPAAVQADLYGLGVLLFHLVTGSYPIVGATLKELRTAHDRRTPKALGEMRSDLPPAFMRVVERALAPVADDRFANAAAMEQALAAALGLAGERPEEPGNGARGGRRGAPGAWRTDSRGDVMGKAARHRWRWHRPALAVGLVATVLGIGWILRNRNPVLVTNRTYTVEASFYRGIQVKQRLSLNDRLRVGDALSLEMQASHDLYVYVINEDDNGEAVLLFPLPGRQPSNPLPPVVRHLLPGSRAGVRDYWQVTSPGGREHFLVIASPERLTAFEQETLALKRAEAGEPLRYIQLSERSLTTLRGVAGIVAPPPRPNFLASGRLFELAATLEPGPESVNGVWIRRIDLENPVP